MFAKVKETADESKLNPSHAAAIETGPRGHVHGGTTRLPVVILMGVHLPTTYIGVAAQGPLEAVKRNETGAPIGWLVNISVPEIVMLRPPPTSPTAGEADDPSARDGLVGDKKLSLT